MRMCARVSRVKETPAKEKFLIKLYYDGIGEMEDPGFSLFAGVCIGLACTGEKFSQSNFREH